MTAHEVGFPEPPPHPGRAGATDPPVCISLLVPSRSRSELLRRFLESVFARAERPDRVEVVVYADEDDPASHGLAVEGLEVRTIVGPRASMGEYNSACLAESRGDVVILGNDDIVIRTRGWDRLVRDTHASVRDGVYLAYPNDLFKGRSVSTFPILSREACRLLGDPFPHAYRGAFIDYHLLDIFKRLERRGHRRIFYLDQVVFEHMHYRAGKGKYDEIYGKRRRFDDDATFLRLRDARRDAAMMLASVIEGGKPAAPDPAPAVGLFGSTVLDRGLPAAWRLRLFLWFLARSVARRLL